MVRGFGFLSVNSFVTTLLVLLLRNNSRNRTDRVKGNLKFGSQSIGVTVVGSQRWACREVNDIIPPLTWVVLKVAEQCVFVCLFFPN